MPKKNNYQYKSVQEIYDNYIQGKNDVKVKTRYVGKESWFHSSVSGLCLRKHYYGSVVQPDEKQSHDINTYRLFRLGDIVHTDIQEAVSDYAKQNGIPIFIENEIRIDDLNMRGFIDLGFVEDGVLYDIKTCNAWKWKTMFGRYAKPDAISRNYKLQLGTYGLWYKRKYGKLNGLVLVFYNKDNSRMREVSLDLSVVDEAEQYWITANKVVNEAKKSGVPPVLNLGVTPAEEWECNVKYCQYFDVCGGGIKGNF
tara:strand:+ start:710 stop:1471 length:762 start_codon:yes stop_codon:yes gene_type:complete